MDIIDKINRQEALLLDVRHHHEWSKGHAKGASHIPVQDLLSSSLTDLDRSKPIYVYCHSGHRAAIAVNHLKGHGFEAINIINLDEWRKIGGDVEA